ncbi:MAG TPA: DUF1385 domain-containing protein [Candidatus Onthovicinus excrementipullorum]|nr:DUF1385 domain-containing protein [Candidatus Onthovicinus excrementipullorum]
MKQAVKNRKCPTHKTSIGGQALIEGVMMRGPKGVAQAVRKPDGTIDVTMKEHRDIAKKYRILRVPLIRGVYGFIDSMIVGFGCLMDSAEKSTEGLLDDEPAESKLDRFIEKHFGPKLMTAVSTIAMVIGLVIAFALFVWAPTVVTNWINGLADGVLTNFRALIEGVMRILIFIAYIAIVGSTKDIKRVFRYHGAEHKTIFCYEYGEELTVENVRKQIRFHPRCGTSFIFVVLIISILISSVISIAAPMLRDLTAVWLCIKILILPLVMGISYEFIKYAGRHDNLFTKICSAPGLWMQRLTTKEPDDGMIEVAIAAMNAVITGNREDDAIK